MTQDYTNHTSNLKICGELKNENLHLIRLQKIQPAQMRTRFLLKPEILENVFLKNRQKMLGNVTSSSQMASENLEQCLRGRVILHKPLNPTSTAVMLGY